MRANLASILAVAMQTAHMRYPFTSRWMNPSRVQPLGNQCSEQLLHRICKIHKALLRSNEEGAFTKHAD